MVLFVKIACVVIFTAVMVAIHQGFMSLRYFFSGDFALGVAVGIFIAFGIALLCQKLEAGK